MRKVFVKHHFYVDEDFKEKDFELSEVTDVTWGTYPDDKPKEGDWFLYVDVESYIQLQEENKLLRECVESFANCITCANGHYKDLARQTLVKIKGDV